MDIVSDCLTRIRNGLMGNLSTVELLYSKQIMSILRVLKEEGYILDFVEKDIRKGIKKIEVSLKYYDTKPVIKEIKRISKPSLRVYSNVADIPVVYNGLGIAILSTSKGILSDFEARQKNIGGEVICYVF